MCTIIMQNNIKNLFIFLQENFECVISSCIVDRHVKAFYPSELNVLRKNVKHGFFLLMMCVSSVDIGWSGKSQNIGDIFNRFFSSGFSYFLILISISLIFFLI